MLRIRLFYVLLVAVATLLMSFRPPAPPVARQAVLADNLFANTLEMPVEEAQGGENTTNTNQQGPLEEIHDLHCSVNKQQLTLWLLDELEANRLHPLLWMCVPLMSCFQTPELV